MKNNKEIISLALNELYTDFERLQSGDWVPDRHSITASQDNVIFIHSRLVKMGIFPTGSELWGKL